MGIAWDDILDDQKGDGDKLPPGGPYVVKAEYAEGVIARSGNPMIKIKFVAVGGPYAGNDVWTNVVIMPGNPNAMKWTLRKLSALGVSRDFLRDTKPTEKEIGEKINAEGPLVEITVKEGDEYEGERRPEVDKINPYKGAQPTNTPTPTPTPSPTPRATDMPKPTLPQAPPAVPPVQDGDEPF